MNPRISSRAVVIKRFCQLFLVCLAVVLVMKAIMTPSIAQSTEERELENKIPQHLPIKVKLKKEKEKAFKELKNEKWARDFELEITNTGDKPIYFISLILILPEIIAPNGIGIAFSIHYGRGQLIEIETKAGPDDVPIKPGETYVYSFSDIVVTSWEGYKKRENKLDPKKLTLKFQALSFGDGTGFVGSNGMAVPHAPDAKSSIERCDPEPNLKDSGGVKGQHASRRDWPTTYSTDDLPATFLLANFLSTESSSPTPLKLNHSHSYVAPVMAASAPNHTSEIAIAEIKMRFSQPLVVTPSEVVGRLHTGGYLAVLVTVSKLKLTPAQA